LVSIFLDAGHGGKDSGAVGNGLFEKDLVLDICKRIQKGLGEYDCKVYMSRETDVYVSLDERTQAANKTDADVLVSVHINASTSKEARGFETYTYIGTSGGTRALQNVIHEEILKQLGDVQDRGKKQKNLHMLRDSKMKAVLTECLFISNPQDAKQLAVDEYRQRIAQGHINGLEKFLGLKRSAQPPPKETVPKKLWHVQVGAFENKDNAEALAKDLTKQGYRPFLKYE
jgi:N-acetylmuramoyl-L-alanine amidase